MKKKSMNFRFYGALFFTQIVFCTIFTPSILKAQMEPDSILIFEYKHTANINGDQSIGTLSGTLNLRSGILVYDALIDKYIPGYQYWPASAVTKATTSGGPIVALEVDGGQNLFTITKGELNYSAKEVTQDQFANITTEINVRRQGNTVFAELVSTGTADYPDLVGMGGPISISQIPNGEDSFIERGTKLLRTADGTVFESQFSTEYTGVAIPIEQVRNLNLTVLEESEDRRNVKLRLQNMVRPADVNPSVMPFDYTHNVFINGEPGIARAVGKLDFKSGIIEYVGWIEKYINGYKFWPTSWLTTVVISGGPIVALEEVGASNLLTLTNGELGHTINVFTEDQFANITTDIQVNQSGDFIIANLTSKGTANYPEIVGMEGGLSISQTPNANGGFTERGTKRLVAADGTIIESQFTADYQNVNLPAAQVREMSFKVLDESADRLNVTIEMAGTIRPAERDRFYEFGMEHSSIGNANLKPSEGKLSVSNIGSSGLDGVKIDLNHGKGMRYFITQAFDPKLTADNAYFQITRNYKRADGHLETSVETIRDIGDLLEIRTNLMGSPSKTIKVFHNDQTVFEMAGHTGAWDLRISSLPAKSDCKKSDCDRAEYTFEPEEIIVIAPNGAEMTADGFLIEPDEYVPMGSFTQEIDIQVSGIPAFDIEKEYLYVFGGILDPTSHQALGKARFNAKDNELTISNIGSSGEDGVLIEFEDFNVRKDVEEFNVDFQRLETPEKMKDGAYMLVSATGQVDNVNSSPLGSVKLLDTGTELEITADFSPVASPTQRIEVYNGGQVIGTISGHTGVVASVTDWPDRIGKIGGNSGIGNGSTKCIISEWDLPIPISIGGGPTLVGDRLGIFIENTTASFGPLSSFSIQLKDIPSLTIVNETISEPGSGSAISAMVACPTSLSEGCPFDAEVKVDMTASSELLGSFTGTLTWDPTILAYSGNAQLLSGYTGLVNVDEPAGLITFNGTNISGKNNVVDIFRADFEVKGNTGDAVKVNLDFSAMAAAVTLTDLLPDIALSNCESIIVESGLLGDVNDDNLVNSTDALAIMSFDANLSLPPKILENIMAGFGDVNLDGSTNSTDALIILTSDIGFPVPYPLGKPFCQNQNTLITEEFSVPRNATEVDIIAFPQESTLGENYYEVPIFIDLTESGLALGSFTAKINWNISEAKLMAYSGGQHNGFDNPVINTANMERGEIYFSNANPLGAKNKVNIFNLRFQKLTDIDQPDVNIVFSSIASANNFEKLVPRAELLTNSVDVLVENDLKVYPNPFSNATNITYSLQKGSLVTISLYDQNGRLVRTLDNGFRSTGDHTIRWNGKDTQNKIVNQGIYFIMLKVDTAVGHSKLIFMN